MIVARTIGPTTAVRKNVRVRIRRRRSAAAISRAARSWVMAGGTRPLPRPATAPPLSPAAPCR